MNQVMIDLWPYLIVPVIGAIGWLFREVFLLKTKATICEKSVESMQKRLDSHSQKQDDILNRINTMEKEVLKETGSVKAEISSLASHVEGLSNLIIASDNGLKIKRDN